MYPYINNMPQGNFNVPVEFNGFRNDMNNYPVAGEYPMSQNQNADERFFWAPFVVGGLAGTALGYGIANNNQLNNSNAGAPIYVPGPAPYYPYQYPYNNYVYPTQNTYYF